MFFVFHILPKNFFENFQKGVDIIRIPAIIVTVNSSRPQKKVPQQYGKDGKKWQKQTLSLSMDGTKATIPDWGKIAT